MLATHGRYGYSAIKERPTYRWPNGAGLAVYVAVGVEEYAFGEGLTEDLLPGASKPDLVNTSWRDYGNRVGAFRLFDRFKTLGIKPAVLLNTAIYDHAPAVIAAAREAGAEFVAHGLSNSHSLATMNPQEEATYLRAVYERIAAEEGQPPKGWSSPWLAHSPATLDLLAAQGFQYVADFRMDDQPVWLNTESGRLMAMPYALELNDSSTIIGRQASAREFAEMIIDEFDEMLEASRDQPLVMSVVVHSFISGQPFRLRALTRALEHIASSIDRIWLTRPGDIASWVGELAQSAGKAAAGFD
ncbi:Polysaccharide deacetylase [Bosea sp. OK403]|uniref:polysaccharide deacetylase family protein n=1 Tax=Bosea sp. OK403 TaxID=1855286 RepID=UPI0008E867C6|nr:polysaccharide deacetylase family protein [Bosea sp. OK403]SFJ71516.1 Polysaccharide deacetylase [Bosea sp. OK403]